MSGRSIGAITAVLLLISTVAFAQGDTKWMFPAVCMDTVCEGLYSVGPHIDCGDDICRYQSDNPVRVCILAFAWCEYYITEHNYYTCYGHCSEFPSQICISDLPECKLP